MDDGCDHQSDARSVTSLLAAIREDVRAAVEFLLMGGWRRNEVLGLRWSDLDLPNRMAWTKLKGGDVVQRPVTNDMVLIIINQPRVGPFVFTYVYQRPMSGLQRHTRDYAVSDIHSVRLYCEMRGKWHGIRPA
jgi:integrase